MKSFTPGAGNPRDSAILAQQNMNSKQASLNASVGGKRKKRSRKMFRGGSNQVNVPQFPMGYVPQGGPNTNPNDQIRANSSTSMQSRAWAADDHLATKMGGSINMRRRPKLTRTRSIKGGYNPNWSWGCYSGGKKTRKNRRHRKKRT
jgi:hypothetical protein